MTVAAASQGLFDFSPGIRGGRGNWPVLNVGSTENSVGVYDFAPGLDPGSIEVSLERGVLSIAGERKSQRSSDSGLHKRNTVHTLERFRRVVSLPDDVDPNAVKADFVDGVLRVSIARRESARPRRIAGD